MWTAWAPDWLAPHFLFDVLAYAVGGAVYRRFRRREAGQTPFIVAVGAIVGAAFGATFLASLQHLVNDGGPPVVGGRTIVGGILGGWAGVEFVKRQIGLATSTGDSFVPALVVGTMLGRLGCFFTGVADETAGQVTSSFLGFDHGDGLPRHPTALYEIAVVAAIGVLTFRGDPKNTGERFRWYMAAYLFWRFMVDFLKPQPWTILGITPIQCAALAGACFAVWSIYSRRRRTTHLTEAT
jgi:phosphatidylglycerol---prolipoprotein diacylglyceryl transferase